MGELCRCGPWWEGLLTNCIKCFLITLFLLTFFCECLKCIVCVYLVELFITKANKFFSTPKKSSEHLDPSILNSE